MDTFISTSVFDHGDVQQMGIWVSSKEKFPDHLCSQESWQLNTQILLNGLKSVGNTSQSELTSLQAKIRLEQLTEVKNQALNEGYHKGLTESTLEINQLKSLVSELKVKITSITGSNGNLELVIKQLNERINRSEDDGYNRGLKEGTSQINGLQKVINDYQVQLASVTGSRNQLELHVNQLNSKMQNSVTQAITETRASNENVVQQLKQSLNQKNQELTKLSENLKRVTDLASTQYQAGIEAGIKQHQQVNKGTYGEHWFYDEITKAFPFASVTDVHRSKKCGDFHVYFHDLDVKILVEVKNVARDDPGQRLKFLRDVGSCSKNIHAAMYINLNDVTDEIWKCDIVGNIPCAYLNDAAANPKLVQMAVHSLLTVITQIRTQSTTLDNQSRALKDLHSKLEVYINGPLLKWIKDLKASATTTYNRAVEGERLFVSGFQQILQTNDFNTISTSKKRKSPTDL
jgi:hypothetical protein